MTRTIHPNPAHFVAFQTTTYPFQELPLSGNLQYVHFISGDHHPMRSICYTQTMLYRLLSEFSLKQAVPTLLHTTFREAHVSVRSSCNLSSASSFVHTIEEYPGTTTRSTKTPRGVCNQVPRKHWLALRLIQQDKEHILDDA